MADTFEAAVQKMAKEQGVTVFDNPARFKNLLADYTGNDFAKERKLLVRIVEEGCAKDIATATNTDVAKRIVLRHLMEEEYLAEGPAAKMVDLLALILHGDKDFKVAKAFLDKGRSAIAIPLLQKLATAGYAKAQTTLANCYEYGKGVHQDFEKAGGWYHEAAEQGDKDAQKVLAIILKQGEADFENAKALLDRGHVDVAVPLLQKFAAAGYAKAQNILGICYANGKGVLRDQTTAAEWFRKAAEQEDAKAQFNLGACYENGKGVPRDDTMAAVLYWKAAEQGNANAKLKLGAYYANEKGVLKTAEAYRKAAELGIPEAQFKLAACYANGKGVPKNHTKAVEWYRKAAEQGHYEARKTLDILYH